MVQELPRVSAVDLACYVLNQAHYSISHLKLQKAIYYLQAYHLAQFDQNALIEEEFQAWLHGPVCRPVWEHFRGILWVHSEKPLSSGEKQAIDSHAHIVKETLSLDQRQFIDDMLAQIMPMSGYELETMTHAEDPWINARGNYAETDRCENVIPKEAMFKYYRGVLATV